MKLFRKIWIFFVYEVIRWKQKSLRIIEFCSAVKILGLRKWLERISPRKSFRRKHFLSYFINFRKFHRWFSFDSFTKMFRKINIDKSWNPNSFRIECNTIKAILRMKSYFIFNYIKIGRIIMKFIQMISSLILPKRAMKKIRVSSKFWSENILN